MSLNIQILYINCQVNVSFQFVDNGNTFGFFHSRRILPKWCEAVFLLDPRPLGIALHISIIEGKHFKTWFLFFVHCKAADNNTKCLLKIFRWSFTVSHKSFFPLQRKLLVTISTIKNDRWFVWRNTECGFEWWHFYESCEREKREVLSIKIWLKTTNWSILWIVIRIRRKPIYFSVFFETFSFRIS